jgi:peroxiredoxin
MQSPSNPHQQAFDFSSLHRGLKLKRLFASILWVLLSTTLILSFFKGLHAGAPHIHQNACLALDPEVLEGHAPLFSLPDLHGKTSTLNSYRGKIILLNFWASWCPPCVEELPSMITLYKQFATSNFQFLTISVDEDQQALETFLKRHQQTLGSFPILLDPERVTAKAYGTEKFPETYLIDEQGKLLYRFVNKRDWSSQVAMDCIASLVKR